MQSRARYLLILIFFQCASIINGDSDNIPVTPEEFIEVENALNFDGKVVLVTGSSSGIGATTARLFAKLGAYVVVTGRDQARIVQVARNCQKLSPKRLAPLAISADLTVPGNTARLVNETIAAFKKIDVLVNNAGQYYRTSIDDPNYNKIFKNIQAINADVPMELSRLAVPHIQRSKGSIIFVSSLLASHPNGETGAYSLSKSAIITFAKVLAQGAGPDVRVNVVSPGIVDGTLIFRNLSPSPRAQILANTVNYTSRKRASVPLDIAKAIVFLASNLSPNVLMKSESGRPIETVRCYVWLTSKRFLPKNTIYWWHGE